jgi:NAD(P)H-dependent flavin oxidoreductase YrpB (nitropropane dioxygenase family)
VLVLKVSKFVLVSCKDSTTSHTNTNLVQQMSTPTIHTPLTKLFGIQHPILLAGMNVAAGPELAAAVTNAGGLGVIGGVGYTPDFLKKQIDALKVYRIAAILRGNIKRLFKVLLTMYYKAALHDKNGPFGVDLLLPQVGGSARKTNYDYTDGKLPGMASSFIHVFPLFPFLTLMVRKELIDIIISEKAKLFVSAVGVPPRWVVDKLHAAGIYLLSRFLFGYFLIYLPGIPVMNMIGAPKHVRKALDAGCDSFVLKEEREVVTQVR